MSLYTARHKNLLLQILKDIYSDTKISPFLGFKGGTAAYLFYGLPRFSVDLDFDLLDRTKEEFVFLKVKEIVKKYGKMKDAKKKRFNLFFLVSYEEKAQNIKIEINRRAFGSQYALKTHLGISMLVMEKEDMFAHKLMAMYERMGKANRDIYDVWFFLKENWPVNKNMVEERSGMTFKIFLQKCILSLKKMENYNILDGMGEVLSEKQKIWAKENLLKDILFLLKLKLSEYTG
jgi:predicted nucleotidyltransferase component of viral defense system